MTDLSNRQYSAQTFSHKSSALNKARGAKPVILPNLKPGDTVYIKSDQSKSQVRDKFVVLTVNPQQKVTTVQNFLGCRRNSLVIQLQNLYKACIDDKTEYQLNEEPWEELPSVSKSC